MGILHYLGLNDPFKGIFKDMTINEAINELKSTNDMSYLDLIAILEGKEIDEIQCLEDIEVEKSTDFTIEKEGNKKLVYTVKYERNPKLRKNAIQIHGTTCMACGFNFEKSYGDRGRDYIEVHHVKPLSNSDEEIDVDPRTDLVVLCANCHRIIHRKKNDILTLEELREIIKYNMGEK